MLTVLVSTISNSLVCLLKNISVHVYAILNDQSFYDALTNDVVSFKQLDPGFPKMQPREDSSQTARISRLMQVFTGRTCPKVCFLTSRLICFA